MSKTVELARHLETLRINNMYNVGGVFCYRLY